MGGTLRAWVNRAGNLLHLCPGCHAWVENNRTVSERYGWLVREGLDPTTVPVLVWSPTLGHAWVTLSDDGCLTIATPPVT
jgi:5-methylcytosine-specific restriction enzyme A